jgi:hypothetical protein
MRTAVLLAALALASLSPFAPAADPPFAAKAEKLDPPAAVAGPVRALLDPEAVVVTGDGGEAVMRVWFRSEIPAKATAEQVANGLTYREIPEGTLVGVVEFPRPFTDFRKQDIPTGVYTLRFAVQPETGDHMGTAPHPEFCLMTPAAADTTPDPVEVKTLVGLSAKVLDGKHPAVLLLFPHYGKDAGPKVVGKGGGVWVAMVRRPVTAAGAKATLGFGITVAGATKQ